MLPKRLKLINIIYLQEMDGLPKEIKVHQWFYVKRPSTRVGPEHYEKREATLSTSLISNEVLIKIEIWSVDPYMRIQQAERDSYDPPHPLNTVQQGVRSIS
jgi:NADPH-dependent curcumin reductase CurA